VVEEAIPEATADGNTVKPTRGVIAGFSVTMTPYVALG